MFLSLSFPLCKINKNNNNEEEGHRPNTQNLPIFSMGKTTGPTKPPGPYFTQVREE